MKDQFIKINHRFVLIFKNVIFPNRITKHSIFRNWILKIGSSKMDLEKLDLSKFGFYSKLDFSILIFVKLKFSKWMLSNWILVHLALVWSTNFRLVNQRSLWMLSWIKPAQRLHQRKVDQTNQIACLFKNICCSMLCFFSNWIFQIGIWENMDLGIKLQKLLCGQSFVPPGGNKKVGVWCLAIPRQNSIRR